MAEERDPRTYAIIGAAMEVHRRIGPGFLEIEEAQTLNYLRVARLSVGLLINFGAPSLQRKRFAMTHL